MLEVGKEYMCIDDISLTEVEEVLQKELYSI